MKTYGKSMLLIDSTHNSVSNYFLSEGKKISLYTIIVRDHVTGKGAPVCWAFAASAATEPIEKLLLWVRHSTGLVPHAIMSDCATAIRNAITGAFGDLGNLAPQHYWCWFHVLKAFKSQALTYLQHRSSEAINDFRIILHSSTDPASHLHGFLTKWSAINSAFAKYARNQWHVNVIHWARFYRTSSHQGINTNNYTESWHRILKSRYIPPPEKRRIDELLQILCNEAEPAFRSMNHRVDCGFEPQRSNAFQLKSKRIADGYSQAALAILGVHTFVYPDHYAIDSFTSPSGATYRVTINDPGSPFKGRVTSCTCPHFSRHGSACKHMYYLARVSSRIVVEDVIAPVHQSTSDMDNFIRDILRSFEQHSETLPAPDTGTTSDIEIITPQVLRSKRMHHSQGISPHSHAPKRMRTSALTSPDDWLDAHPNLVQNREAGGEVGEAAHRGSLVESLDFPTSPELGGGTEAERVARLLRSAMKALAKSADVLSKARDRKRMAGQVSVKAMERFKDVGLTIGQMVENGTASRSTLLASFSSAGNPGDMCRRQLDSLIFDLQSVGWEGLNRAHKLLKKGNLKDHFCKTATTSTMQILREACFEMVGLLEDAGILVAAKQIR